jgi:cell division protein FtsL
MTRINFLLLAAVVATMLYIVKVQYESRQLFVAIEKATVDVRKLELESASLQVDSRAQATPLIIEKLAKEKLQMRSATPAVTQYTSTTNTTANTTSNATKPQAPGTEVAK